MNAEHFGRHLFPGIRSTMKTKSKYRPRVSRLHFLCRKHRAELHFVFHGGKLSVTAITYGQFTSDLCDHFEKHRTSVKDPRNKFIFVQKTGHVYFSMRVMLQI